MPRVILRTVEPANEFACQSDEKRCTLPNASRPMATMVRALRRLSRNVTSWREMANSAPRPMKIASARHTGAVSAREPDAMASITTPDASGTLTSTSVEAMRAASSTPNRPGNMSQ